MGRQRQAALSQAYNAFANDASTITRKISKTISQTRISDESPRSDVSSKGSGGVRLSSQRSEKRRWTDPPRSDRFERGDSGPELSRVQSEPGQRVARAHSESAVELGLRVGCSSMETEHHRRAPPALPISMQKEIEYELQGSTNSSQFGHGSANQVAGADLRKSDEEEACSLPNACYLEAPVQPTKGACWSLGQRAREDGVARCAEGPPECTGTALSNNATASKYPSKLLGANGWPRTRSHSSCSSRSCSSRTSSRERARARAKIPPPSSHPLTSNIAFNLFGDVSWGCSGPTTSTAR